MDEKLYTPEDLANILQLSRYTIYEMVKRGDISAHHVGKSIRVSQSQLEQYLVGAKKAENVYTAEVIEDGAEQYALINGVKVFVANDTCGTVKLCISPEDIILSLSDIKCSARNVLKSTVKDIIYDHRTAKLLIDAGFPLIVLITAKSLKEMDIKKGDTVFAIFKAMSIRIIKA